MLPTSAKQAKELGSSTYFTGKPCKNGHVSERFTSNHTCVACDIEKGVKYLATDGAKSKKSGYMKKYRSCPEVKDREKHYMKEWAARNPDKVNAYSMKRWASQIGATPDWLSKEQLSAIMAYYEEAKMLEQITGVPHQVDHIVPLQNSLVCGLHVPWNLQVLTAKENRDKSNSFDGAKEIVTGSLRGTH